MTDTADPLPVDPQSLAKAMAATRARHSGDVVAQMHALDALYRRLQEQEGPLMGQASLDAWLAAGRIATEAEAAS